MATYVQLQSHIKSTAGFTVKTCWLADIMSQYGLTRRFALNRIDPSRRVHPCPSSKRATIESALRHFGMIP